MMADIGVLPQVDIVDDDPPSPLQRQDSDSEDEVKPEGEVVEEEPEVGRKALDPAQDDLTEYGPEVQTECMFSLLPFFESDKP